MKVSNQLVHEVRQCCHHGHGASVWADGTVMQAISYNDCIAYSTADGWVYRLAYIDDPKITRAQLQEIFDYCDVE